MKMRLITILILWSLFSVGTTCLANQNSKNEVSESLQSDQSDPFNPPFIEIDNYKLTPLGYAIYQGNLEEVKKMLEAGTDERKCMSDDIYEYDIIYTAVYFDKKEILQFFIDTKQSLNVIYTDNGLIALTMACQMSNYDIASMLLAGGADVEGGGYSGGEVTYYPIIEAVSRNNVELVKLLLKYHADTQVTDREGHTPLDIAKYNKNSQLIALLNSAEK